MEARTLEPEAVPVQNSSVSEESFADSRDQEVLKLHAINALNMDRCAHCDTRFRGHGKTRATKAFIARIVRNGIESKEKVKINEALKTIYFWKFNANYELDERIAFCGWCGLAVAKLYEALQLYEQLAVSHSYLSQLIEAQEENLRPEKSCGLSLPKQEVQLHVSENEDQINEEEALGDSQAENLASVRKDESVNNLDSIFISGDINHDEKEEEEINFQLSPRAVNPVTTPEPEVFRKPFLCEMCAKGFETQRSLQTHLVLAHGHGGRQKDYVCHCGKSYYYPYLLANHQKVHSEHRPIHCDHCESRFKTKNALRHHMLNVHQASGKTFSCQFCPRTYKEERNLREHMNISHKPVKSIIFFECKYGCGCKTPRKRTMLFHYRQRCKKKPKSESSEGHNANETTEIHHGLTEPKFETSADVKTYVLDNDREPSELIEVSNNPPNNSPQVVAAPSSAPEPINPIPVPQTHSTFPCPEGCGRSFKTKQYLKVHVKKYCLRRKDAPIRVRLQKKKTINPPPVMPNIEVFQAHETSLDDLESSSMELVPVEVVNMLPIEIMDSTAENSREELPEHDGHDHDIPMYLEVDGEFIETETISFHEVMDMEVNFSTL